MSMRDYSFVDYGIVLNDIVDYETLCELAEDDKIEHQFSFTGEAFEVRDDGYTDWGNCETYSDDTVYYVSLPRYPNLFKAAYRDMNELVLSAASRYRKIKGLPKLTNEQIRGNLRLIQGTYYG